MPGEASKRDYWKHRDDRLAVSAAYYADNRAYVLAQKSRRLAGPEGDAIRQRKRERDAGYRAKRRISIGVYVKAVVAARKGKASA